MWVLTAPSGKPYPLDVTCTVGANTAFTNYDNGGTVYMVIVVLELE